MSGRYHIKNPSKSRGKGKRASFSIFLAKPQDDGTTKTETVKNADVESINKNYLAGIYDWETARKNIEQIRNRLNAEIGKFTFFTGNKTNGRVLEQYWNEEYQGRKIKESSMNSAKHDLRRALDALGKISIVSGSGKEIQNTIDNSGFDMIKQRRIIARLNQILKFLGRKDIKLQLPKKPRRKIHFLTTEEFQKVLALEPLEEVRTLYEVCFYTGARLGEAIYLSSDSLAANEKFVQIDFQLTEDGKEVPPKWDSVRPAYIFPEGIDALRRWDDLKDKIEISRTAVSARFRRACQKAFQGKKNKMCKLHDLRHSYAIRLMGYGVNLSLVAQSLGNDIKVCQEYYVGHQLTHDSIDLIDSKIKNSKVVF